MNKLFVYGTLRKNERNHHFLNNAKLVSEQSWTLGKLVDTSFDYPALVDDPDSFVYGEVYEITDQEMELVDQLEGYNENNLDSHYMREMRTVHTDSGVVQAYTYFYSKEKDVSSYKSVPFGDWRLKVLLDQGVPLYFAYGSCMDCERIEQAGMLNGFHALGLGVLDRHELQFTISVDDGGRADIVESVDQHVEGVVYEISEDALHYLYRREGVHTGMYRPAVVDVSLNGELVTMLTFIVKDKMLEQAPPDHYLNEIVRGGSPYLSERYLKKIQDRVNELRVKK